jgi:hypothetical protein
MNAFRRDTRRLLGLACTATAAALPALPASAQSLAPFYVGVSQSFQRDSNVYRTATDEVSETVSITGVRLGVDQKLGRQRVFARGDAQVHRYQTQDVLDNKSYAIEGGLDWETIETLAGNLHYSTRNSLVDLGSTGGTRTVSDQTTQQFSATGRYGLPQGLGFDAGYEYRKLSFKNPVFDNRNYSQDTVNLATRWGGSQFTFSVGVRETRGRTPHYTTVAPFEDELKRRDYDFGLTWTASGFSTVNARISRTKESHSLSPNAGSTDTTGSLGWNYQATGRLVLNALITRDTGTETTFLGPAPDGTRPLPLDASRISTTAALTGRYALTAKTALSGNARYNRGTLTNGNSEKVTGYGLTLHYEVLRSLALSCSATREERSLAGTTAYNANILGCAGELTLR